MNIEDLVKNSQIDPTRNKKKGYDDVKIDDVTGEDLKSYKVSEKKNSNEAKDKGNRCVEPKEDGNEKKETSRRQSPGKSPVVGSPKPDLVVGSVGKNSPRKQETAGRGAAESVTRTPRSSVFAVTQRSDSAMAPATTPAGGGGRERGGQKRKKKEGSSCCYCCCVG